MWRGEGFIAIWGKQGIKVLLAGCVLSACFSVVSPLPFSGKATVPASWDGETSRETKRMNTAEASHSERYAYFRQEIAGFEASKLVHPFKLRQLEESSENSSTNTSSGAGVSPPAGT